MKELQIIIGDGERISEELHWRKISTIFLLFVMFVTMPVFSAASFHSLFPAINTWQGKAVFILQALSIIFSAVYLWIVTVIRAIDGKAFKNISLDIRLKLDNIARANDKKLS